MLSLKYGTAWLVNDDTIIKLREYLGETRNIISRSKYVVVAIAECIIKCVNLYLLVCADSDRALKFVRDILSKRS